MKPKQVAVWAITTLLLASVIYASQLGKFKPFFAYAFSSPSTEWSRTFGGAGNDGAYYVMQTLEALFCFSFF